MMMPVNVHEIIPIAVERTLDSLAGGIVLCGVAWTWLRVAYRQNSASRFFILFILLIGIAVLPFVGLPSGEVAPTLQTHSVFTLPAHFAEYLFMAWAVVASALLTRVAIGFLQLVRLKQSCVVLDVRELSPAVRSVLQESARQVTLCVSDRVNVPTALGFGSARIAIPTWLLDQLSPEELHHLVLHEAAHLRRWDDWTNLAQRVLGALLFFHPAVWWLQRRIALEREMACDECVLAETGNARAYAKSLATIAERSFVHRTVALAQAAVSRLHDTSLRVAKILSPRPLKANSVGMVIVSAAAFGGISVSAALYSPNLVSFTEVETPTFAKAPVTPAVQLAKFAPAQRAHQTIASAPVTRPLKVARKPVAATTIARSEEKPSLLMPVKAKQQQYMMAQPAMLVVWQETYSADGSVVTIQQSYWRVVVYQQVTPKELPAKIT